MNSTLALAVRSCAAINNFRHPLPYHWPCAGGNGAAVGLTASCRLLEFQCCSWPKSKARGCFRNQDGFPMKCQKCNEPATFHITELAAGKPTELHLCEDCARQYLTQADEEPQGSPSLASVLSQQLQVGQTVEDLAKADQQSCPVCGITFYEFRSQGRLGCPHDYVVFARELDPLIQNIHNKSEHHGKRPKRAPFDTDKRTDLIRLRREMKEAVDAEDYELASQLRDQIKEIESSGGESSEGSP